MFWGGRFQSSILTFLLLKQLNLASKSIAINIFGYVKIHIFGRVEMSVPLLKCFNLVSKSHAIIILAVNIYISFLWVEMSVFLLNCYNLVSKSPMLNIIAVSQGVIFWIDMFVLCLQLNPLYIQS